MSYQTEERKALLGAQSPGTPENGINTTSPSMKQSPRLPRMMLKVEDASSTKKICGLPAGVFAGASYCCASMSMVLLNKMALSSFNFTSANALLTFQCLVCVSLVKICEYMGYVKVEPFNPRVVRLWLPVNAIFVGMIATSFWALQSLNVAMLTVLKNLTNLFTIGGDYFFYGRSYGTAIWACMGLMLLSALCGAFTDLTFNATGYFWQLVNCAFTAAYSLYMRGAMDRVATVTSDGKKLNEFSLVYYNNLLSLPFLAAMMIFTGELHSVWREPDLNNPSFLLVALFSGLIGFGISFTSLWFISTTTPTIYSLVGSLNKVPLAFIGLFLFAAPWSVQNLASISVGLAAGVVFAVAKSRGY
jgi:GDP-mannose transporter